MTSDAYATGMRRLANEWVSQADARESHAPGVPDAVAANLRTCAARLLASVEELERATAYLTVKQFAEETGQSEQTVRRLCLQGRLDGVTRDAHNDYAIPRGAKRIAPSAIAQAS